MGRRSSDTNNIAGRYKDLGDPVKIRTISK